MTETNSNDKYSTEKHSTDKHKDDVAVSNISASSDAGGVDFDKANQGISEADSPALDLIAAVEKAFESADGSSKFSLNKMGQDCPFVPALGDNCKYILDSLTMKQTFEVIEELREQRMPIGRSNRSALFNSGVATPSARKVWEWFRPWVESFLESCDEKALSLLRMGSSTGANSGFWLCAVSGIRSSKAFREQGYAQEHCIQFDFLEERCNADIEMFAQVREAIEAGNVEAGDDLAVLNLMLPYWQQYSLVSITELDKYKQAVELHAKGNLVGDVAIAGLLTSYFQIHFDFYFHLFASYEVGFILSRQTTHKELTESQGLFCRAIKRYANRRDDRNWTCLGELLEEIRDVVDKRVEKLSARRMAMSIGMSLDPKNPSTQRNSDRHYNTLRAWRNGKDVPSVKALESFFEDLSKAVNVGTDSNLHMLLLSQMAIDIDKFVKHWRGQLKDTSELQDADPVIAGLYAAIGRYEVYYQHYLDKVLNEIAEA